MSQRGFDQLARETADLRKRTGRGQEQTPLWLQSFAAGHNDEGTCTRVLVAGTAGHGLPRAWFALLTTGSASATEEPRVEQLKTSTAVCGTAGEDTRQEISYNNSA